MKKLPFGSPIRHNVIYDEKKISKMGVELRFAGQYNANLKYSVEHDLQQTLTKIAPRWRSRWVRQQPHVLELLDAMYPGVALSIQIHSVVHAVSPWCKVCGKPIKTIGKTTCSVQCRVELSRVNGSLSLSKQKAKDTIMSKYGVDNVRKIPGVEQRRKQTMLDRYGQLISPRTQQASSDRVPHLNELGRQTLMERYGVTNPGQLPDHRKKSQATLVKKHGVDNYFHSQEFQQRRQQRVEQHWRMFGGDKITDNSVSAASDDLQALHANPNNRIDFSCQDCGQQHQLASETFKYRINKFGHACTNCLGINRGSAAEAAVADFVSSLGFATQRNIRLLDGQEIDIFVPSRNLAIEYNGLFWHNDLKINKRYHSQKTAAAAQRGITLIHIFEDEWVHSPDIVKSRLRNLLGCVDQVVHARKCTVKPVDSQTARQFLDQNHIQGHSPSTVKLGLFNGDQLVSLMTFALPNRAKGQRSKKDQQCWELARFASVLDTRVVGGASRLFSHFVRQYNPDQVLSFADLRWSTGNVYQQLGFQYQGCTALGYWYVDLANCRRVHRFALRKNSQDRAELTEYENRLAQGYLRIWDCGHSRWVWSKKQGT
jgi:predicted nucleic acid-binding Zn ribbon protein